MFMNKSIIHQSDIKDSEIHEPLAPAEQETKPETLTATPNQASPRPVPTEPQKTTNKVFIVAAVAVLIIAATVAAILLLNSSHSNKSDNSYSGQAIDNSSGAAENEPKNDAPENTNSDSDYESTDSAQDSSRTVVRQEIAYLGELECDYIDEKLRECTIPSERVLNRPQGINMKFVLVYPDSNGSFALSNNDANIGSISKNSANSYTVTISNPDDYNIEGLESLSSSAIFTFDKDVVSTGIGSYGNAIGEECAFFATSDGNVYYSRFKDLIKGQSAPKKAEGFSSVVAFMRGASLETQDGEHYFGGHMPYAIRSDGFVYGLTLE